jgi:co-chaperonin GroES (HSP10)
MLLSPLHDHVLIKRIRVLIKRIEEQETLKGGIITPGTARESQEDEVLAAGAVKKFENGFCRLVTLRKAIGYFSENTRERKSKSRIKNT